MSKKKNKTKFRSRTSSPHSGLALIGQGKYTYVRATMDGRGAIFRFETALEAQAAMEKGAELDHIIGAPPHLVLEVQKAARLARHAEKKYVCYKEWVTQKAKN